MQMTGQKKQFANVIPPGVRLQRPCVKKRL